MFEIMRNDMNTNPIDRIAAVIPALNEAGTISQVILNVKLYAFPIVVDDGSSDSTALLAIEAGAVVVAHEKNLGYDSALQTGLFKAIQLGFEFAVTLDADGQHSPGLLIQFKNQLLNGADVVVGVRDHFQRFSESIFSWFGRQVWKISDPLCGMKAYRLIHLEKLGYFDSYKSIGTEYSIRCANTKLKIVNIPVVTNARVGKSRFGSGLKPNYRILRALLLGLINTKL